MSQENGTEEVVAEEQVNVIDDKLKDFVAKTANAASSAQSTRVMKAMEKKLSEFQETLKAQILDSLPQATAQDSSSEDSSEAPANAELAKMQKKFQTQLREATKKVEAAERARTEERLAGMRNEEETKLKEALRENGVTDGYLKGAVALLIHAENKISRDSEGRIVFKSQQEWGVDEKPLTEGIQEWVNSPEGKHYLPPRPAVGSGNTGGTAPNLAKGAKLSTSDKLAVLGNLLAGRKG